MTAKKSHDRATWSANNAGKVEWFQWCTHIMNDSHDTAKRAANSQQQLAAGNTASFDRHFRIDSASGKNYSKLI